MNAALVLSGGSGQRMGTDIPKQYLRIQGKMIVTYALEPILASPQIDAIWIAAEKSWWEPIRAELEEKPVFFVPPGTARRDSIRNGLRAITEYADRDNISETDKKRDTKDTVLIHDAVRPLLTKELLHACYEALPGHDGVMPVLPMKDTVYLSDAAGGHIETLLDRARVFAGQAPELFVLDAYDRANRGLPDDVWRGIHGSAEPAVMADMDIVMIPGDENNFKITTPQDLERFRAIVAAR